jgi:hypothetical protein
MSFGYSLQVSNAFPAVGSGGTLAYLLRGHCVAASRVWITQQQYYRFQLSSCSNSVKCYSTYLWITIRSIAITTQTGVEYSLGTSCIRFQIRSWDWLRVLILCMLGIQPLLSCITPSGSPGNNN